MFGDAFCICSILKKKKSFWKHKPKYQADTTSFLYTFGVCFFYYIKGGLCPQLVLNPSSLKMPDVPIDWEVTDTSGVYLWHPSYQTAACWGLLMTPKLSDCNYGVISICTYVIPSLPMYHYLFLCYEYHISMVFYIKVRVVFKRYLVPLDILTETSPTFWLGQLKSRDVASEE